MKRSVDWPRPTAIDRQFWISFAHTVNGLRDMLCALNSDTAGHWYREGFRRQCTWESRHIGRPQIDREPLQLVRRMQTQNVTWADARIRGELFKLGYEICEAGVSNTMKKIRKLPSQRWSTCLANHHEAIAAVDFFTVPTATTRTLHLFVVILHARRRALHFNVTALAPAHWTAQRLTEAYPVDAAPTYLLRDGDAIYGAAVQRSISNLNMAKT